MVFGHDPLFPQQLRYYLQYRAHISYFGELDTRRFRFSVQLVTKKKLFILMSSLASIHLTLDKKSNVISL